MLNGIDISGHQPGDIPRWVSADFVIIKATGGSGFSSPNAAAQQRAARDRGQRVGFYHFAGDSFPVTTPEIEATNFLQAWLKLSRPGDIPVLDWEDPRFIGNVAWARRWCDLVQAATGVTPLLYCNLSVALGYAWGPVQELGVKLWLAYYGNDAPVNGYQELDPPRPSFAGWDLALYQYTEHGRLPGYAGDLDLNIAYEDPWASGAELVPGVGGLAP